MSNIETFELSFKAGECASTIAIDITESGECVRCVITSRKGEETRSGDLRSLITPEGFKPVTGAIRNTLADLVTVAEMTWGVLEPVS